MPKHNDDVNDADKHPLISKPVLVSSNDKVGQ